MNRRRFAIARGLALAACAGLLFNLGCAAPKPPEKAGGVTKSPPRAAVTEAPKVKPAAAPVEAPRPSARRAAALKPAPAPSAPAPVIEAQPTGGLLHIDSDVPGAQVFIDREYIGATPVTASNVTPGTHRLNSSAKGYDGVADTIEVSPGERDILIRFKEVRLDAKMDVVHKHRLGSCKGRLVATPQGLRYETTEKNDAFSAGLLDLDTFQVDYLEKILRVKLKNGKRFDFTDPEGNADRLFVFHRDVEKAREKIKNGA